MLMGFPELESGYLPTSFSEFPFLLLNVSFLPTVDDLNILIIQRIEKAGSSALQRQRCAVIWPAGGAGSGACWRPKLA